MKQQELILTKKLKVLCITIYSAVVIALVALICTVAVEERKAEKTSIVVQGDAKESVLVQGNNNIVNVNVWPVAKNYETMALIGVYSSKVLDIVRKEWSDGPDKTNFSLSDANNLLQKINFYSTKHRIDLTTAIQIVAIESSFNASAHNVGGGAYGLCQVTRPCLDEYNRELGKSYSLEDMYDTDRNLEVGFWYYHRILTWYADKYDYITTTTERARLRDAYIAYNYGVTAFKDIGRSGRNDLRNGIYPKYTYKGKNYGGPIGSVYSPMNRFNRIYDEWCS